MGWKSFGGSFVVCLCMHVCMRDHIMGDSVAMCSPPAPAQLTITLAADLSMATKLITHANLSDFPALNLQDRVRTVAWHRQLFVTN